MPDKSTFIISRPKIDLAASREFQAVSFDSVQQGLPPKLEDAPGSGTSQGSTPTGSRISLPGADAAKSSSSLKLGATTSPRPSSNATSRRSSAHTSPKLGEAAFEAPTAFSDPTFQAKKASHLSEDRKRDSGVAPSLKAMEEPLARSVESSSMNVPAIVLQEESPSTLSKTDINVGTGVDKSHDRLGTSLETQFRGLTTDIESGELEDFFSADKVSFSKRGSLLWGKEKSRAFRETKAKQMTASKVDRSRSLRENKIPEEVSAADVHGMTAEERRLSKRVRSMYEYGDESTLQWLADPHLQFPPDIIKEESIDDTRAVTSGSDDPSKANDLFGNHRPYRNSGVMSIRSKRESMVQKGGQEFAGGIEDWTDVEGGDVDRYGFIKPKQPASRPTSRLPTPTPPQNPDSFAHNLAPINEDFHNDPTRPITPATPSANEASPARSRVGRMLSPRMKPQSSSPSIFSGRSNTSLTPSFRRRSFSRRSRRLAEASNILQLTPSIGADIDHVKAESPRTAALKASRERKREFKWQSMAIAVQRSDQVSKNVVGAGATEYNFNSSDSKLISRTWKGIPDRWRAAAWKSFLLSSSRRQLGSSAPSDTVLTTDFQRFQDQDCVDDVQIDMDVPRTIARHIMFRSRYRGGQRLMFRVLHALSLKFPETGYVQGMAPLAATLLCYYDEEAAFAMAVRMWMLRGLQFLYSPGFEGLMSTLGELEATWLDKSDIKRSLDNLSIGATSYATKWYLTLFNHTLPFSAQLRVWDVFILLGDPGRTLDKPDFSVLHAVAASLIDGMHDVIVGAEFENAMGVLTSAHGTISDDILMSVARKRYRDQKR